MQNNNQQQLPIVALLIAVVLVFGAIWSQDEGLSRTGISTNRLHRKISTSNEVDETEEFVGRYDSPEFSIPLPHAPGRYRIVNSSGFSTIDSFTIEELSETGLEIDSSQRNLYEIECNGIRWYFIRLEKSRSETDLSTIDPTLPPIAARPDLGMTYPRMLLSTFDTVRSSISSGYRHATRSVESAFDRVKQTRTRFYQMLVEMPHDEEEFRFPATHSGIDQNNILDSVEF